MRVRTSRALAILAMSAAMAIAVLSLRAATAASPGALEWTTKALALTPDPARGQVLYIKHCAACHSPKAWGNGPKEVPALAGQREYYLLEQLIHFHSLDRIAPDMHRVVTRPELDNPQALRDVAAYVSRRALNQQPDHGDGRELSAGERIYKQTCASCHGNKGEGSDAEPIPAIGGQHYYYVLAQLKGFAAGHRTEVEPPVIDVTAGLSSEEMQGVADYVSRLSALRNE